MAEGWKKCAKCTTTKKGCTWSGVSMTGPTRGRRATRVTKKKATDSRGARKGMDAADGKGKARAEEQSEERPAKALRRTSLP